MLPRPCRTPLFTSSVTSSARAARAVVSSRGRSASSAELISADASFGKSRRKPKATDSLSRKSTDRALGAQHDPADALGHASRLLDSVGFDGETIDDLPPSSGLLFNRDEFRRHPYPGSCRHRSRKADAIPAHVDAERDLLQVSGIARGDLFAKAVDQAQGEVAVGDRGAERGLALRALDIDVNPLMVAGDLGEGVDVLLGHRPPRCRTTPDPDRLPQACNRICTDGHGLAAPARDATGSPAPGGPLQHLSGRWRIGSEQLG